MPFPFIPVVIVALTGAAWHQQSQREKKTALRAKGVLTPERKAIYETAINELREPEKLRILAKTFREVGLPVHATMLEKRASLREMPQDMKVQRRAAFRKAMQSTKKNEILNLANIYERQGATGSAKALRDYAITLPDQQAQITPIEPKTAAEVVEVIQNATKPEEALDTQDMVEEPLPIEPVDEVIDPTHSVHTQVHGDDNDLDVNESEQANMLDEQSEHSTKNSGEKV